MNTNSRMEFQFFTLDVFAQRKFEGNQLAVIPNAEGLDGDQMQKIAQEFNYSETVFIKKGDSKFSWNVRIFTPTSEIDFAGHPNIGAAILLANIVEFNAKEKVELVFRERVGDIPITIHYENSKPVYAELAVAQLPQNGPVPPTKNQIAESIGLDISDVDSNQESAAYSCGLPFLFVPILSLRGIKKAALDNDKWKKHLSSYWAPQVYLVTKDVEDPKSDFHARMFAPALGIAEDPATGSAVAAFSGFLAKLPKYQNGVFSFTIEQGFEMGRPSILEMSFESKMSKVTKVQVKGKAIIVSRGEIEI